MRRIGELASITLALVVGAYQLGFADDAVRGTRQLLMGSEEPPPGANDPWSPNYVAPAPGPYFRNCGEARAAGAAALHAGDPGYRGGLDRDRDGVACEPYRGR